MSRRHPRTPDPDVHTVRIVCSRGHQKRNVAILDVDCHPDSRAWYEKGLGADLRTPVRLTVLALEHSPTAADVYDDSSGNMALKPRWRCTKCGEDVTVSAIVADHLATYWADNGVAEVDLSDLRRTISEQ